MSNNESQLSQRRRTEVIFLRRGETATRTCGDFSGRTVRRRLRRGEALVVICRHSRRRFVFVCGRPRFARTLVLDRGTRIVVKCCRRRKK